MAKKVIYDVGCFLNSTCDMRALRGKIGHAQLRDRGHCNIFYIRHATWGPLIKGPATGTIILKIQRQTCEL